MNRTIFGIATLALCMALSTIMIPAALAYSGGNEGGLGGVGSITLEEQLLLAERKVETAAANPATGSGTPYLNADGIFGASAIAGGIFGGIAAAFLIKGRSGRYAAYGRG